MIRWIKKILGLNSSLPPFLLDLEVDALYQFVGDHQWKLRAARQDGKWILVLPEYTLRKDVIIRHVDVGALDDPVFKDAFRPLDENEANLILFEAEVGPFKPFLAFEVVRD